MLRQRIAFDTPAPLPIALAVHMLAGVGRPQFAEELLKALWSALPSSHCTVFALDAGGEVSAVSQASAYGDQATTTAGLYIAQGLYRRDKHVRWLATRKVSSTTQAWLVHQQAHEIADPEHRQACFGDIGIREKLALLLLTADGRRFIVNLYRNLSLPAFVAHDHEQLSQLAPLIDAMLQAHLRVSAGVLQQEPRRDDLLKSLSGREREVIAQVMSGRTTREVAALLGLSSNTVLTYRYRAFRTLGIRSMRELMAVVGGRQPVPPTVMPSMRKVG